jgi:hypothetical protein
LTGGDISYIQNGYLILRIGELERKKALTFMIGGPGASSYRYSLDPLDAKSNIVVNLEPDDRMYNNGYVQIFLIHHYTES